ncbi:MAG: hypothetical protein ACXV5D_05995, partial [Halobacteriota archaeon]
TRNTLTDAHKTEPLRYTPAHDWAPLWWKNELPDEQAGACRGLRLPSFCCIIGTTLAGRFATSRHH